ncbi:hypothetical protein [Promicromonospora sukumoe]
MRTLIERGEIIALDCPHLGTVLFFDPSYGPYEKCVDCEVILDEETPADDDNELTDDELAVLDEVAWSVVGWCAALTAGAVVGLGLLWMWVTA